MNHATALLVPAALVMVSTNAQATIPVATGSNVVWHGDFDGDGALIGPCGARTEGYRREETIRNEQIQVTQNPLAEGQFAARFEVRHDDVFIDDDGTPFSESRSLLDPCIGAFVNEKDERWYRWQVFLPAGYISSFPKWDQLGTSDATTSFRSPGGYNVEWHHDGGGLAPLLLGTSRESSGEYFTLCMNKSTDPNQPNPCPVKANLLPIIRERWVDWLMHAKWSANSASGMLEIWADTGSGMNSVFARQDSNMYQNAQGQTIRNYWTVGLYRNGHVGDPQLRYDGPGGRGTGSLVYPPPEPVTVIYLDGFVIGRTRESIYQDTDVEMILVRDPVTGQQVPVLLSF